MSPTAEIPKSKAFGKFPAGAQKDLKDWEAYLGIDPKNHWKSNQPCIQNLLRHLTRHTRSEASRYKMLREVYNFSQYTGQSPKQLVNMSKKKIVDLLRDYIDEKMAGNASKYYLNGILRRLKTFFRVNDKDKLKVEAQFLPARYRKRAEYIPTKDEAYRIADASRTLRDRALIQTLFSSGLRVSTALALSYRDVEKELKTRQKIITIPVYPEMKARNPDAAKGQIPYYSFISEEATEALRAYLADRKARMEKIGKEEPLFCSEWSLYQRKERPLKWPTLQTVNRMIKRAAENAGVAEYQHVSAHCFRKTFESVLRSPTVDGGRMDISTQQFLFGHILPGSQDTYYDKTKVDYHREEYRKLDFSRPAGAKELSDILLASVRAASAGISEDPEMIISEYARERYGDDFVWRRLPQAEQAGLVKEAMEWKRDQMPVEYETKEKVVKPEEVEDLLKKGWSFVHQIDAKRCVVRRRK